jgi:PKD repeat protein
VNWGTSTLLSLKTESATNLRYRDDFEIMTSNVYYGAPGGLSLVPGTYHVFGNNGTTAYQGSVANGNTSLNGDLQANPRISATTLYTDLTTGSDHLPVVADYIITVLDTAPTASFNATPTNGTTPLSVTFTDTSTGNVTNWFWNFGDGSTTNLTTNSVLHIYTNAGVFGVTEIVTGSGGASTNTQPNLITILTPFQAWQLQYFGCTNCPQAQTNADSDSTGQNNFFKYVAGLNPTNPAAIFAFQVVPVTNQPTWKNISFSPVVAGRTYTPQFSTDLGSGVWQRLTTLVPPVTNGTQVTFTDTNAVMLQEYYRVNISLP